jgi:membrane protein YdbS with pleckstrin-like domain
VLPPRAARTGDIEKYLAHGERVIFILRRHSMVLDAAIGIWLAALGVGVGLGAASSHQPHWHLGVFGGWIVLAGAAFLAWKTGGWWVARYVITDERVLLIEGVVSRRVRAVPLSKVTHTDYRRTLSGRLLGYGTISLDSAGTHDGLRELTTIPKPDEVYRLIMSLVSGSGSRPAVQDAALVDTGPMPRLIL